MSALASGGIRSTRVVILSAMAAGILWFAGVALAMAAFNRSNAVPYSVLNHTISELGMPYASSLTWFYNGSEAAAGLLLLPSYLALRRSLSTRSGNVAAALGGVTCLGLTALGVQGLQRDLFASSYRFVPFLTLHNELSAVFFLGWLATAAVFTGIFLRRWRDPFCRLLALVGIGSFLVIPAGLWAAFHANPVQAGLARDLKDPVFLQKLRSPASAAIFSPWLDSYRPHLWWPAVLEWSAASSFILWQAAALLFLWRQTKRLEHSSQ
jgi:Protein of unknown function (DUF998)